MFALAGVKGGRTVGEVMSPCIASAAFSGPGLGSLNSARTKGANAW